MHVKRICRKFLLANCLGRHFCRPRSVSFSRFALLAVLCCSLFSFSPHFLPDRAAFSILCTELSFRGRTKILLGATITTRIQLFGHLLYREKQKLLSTISYFRFLLSFPSFLYSLRFISCFQGLGVVPADATGGHAVTGLGKFIAYKVYVNWVHWFMV